MPRWLKITLLVLAGIVLLILFVLAFPNFFIAPFARPIIVSQIEAHTCARATLAELHLTIFNGVYLEGLALYDKDDPPDAPPVVYVGHVAAPVKVLPLISKKVDLGVIELHDVDVRLVREEDGRMNLARVLGPPPGTPPAPEKPEEPSTTPPGELPLERVTLAGLSVERVHVAVEDPALGEPIEASDIEAHVGPLAIARTGALGGRAVLDAGLALSQGRGPVSVIRLNAGLPAGARVTVPATLAPEVDFSIDEVDLGVAKAFAGPALPLDSLAGKLRVKVVVGPSEAAPGALAATVHLGIGGLVAKGGVLEGGGLDERGEVRLDATGTWRPSPNAREGGEAALEKLAFVTSFFTLEGHGSASGVGGAAPPVADGRLDAALDVDRARKIAGKKAALPPGLTAGGKVKLAAEAKPGATPGEMTFKVKIDLADLVARMAGAAANGLPLFEKNAGQPLGFYVAGSRDAAGALTIGEKSGLFLGATSLVLTARADAAFEKVDGTLRSGPDGVVLAALGTYLPACRGAAGAFAVDVKFGANLAAAKAVEGDKEKSLTPYSLDAKVTAKDLALEDPSPHAKGPAVKLAKASFAAKLAGGAAEVGPITVDGLAVHVVREKDGSTNLDHLSAGGGPAPAPEPEAAPVAADSGEKKKATLPLARVVIEPVKVANVTLDVDDRKDGRHIVVDRCGLDVQRFEVDRDLKLGRPIVVKAGLRAMELVRKHERAGEAPRPEGAEDGKQVGLVSLAATISSPHGAGLGEPEKLEAKVDGKVESLDLGAVKALAGTAVPLAELRGVFDATLSADSVGGKTAQFEAHATIADLRAAGGSLGEGKHIAQKKVALEVKGTADLAAQKADVPVAKLDMSVGTVSAKLGAESWKTVAKLVADVDVRLDMAAVEHDLSAFVPPALESQGPLAVEVKAHGPENALKFTLDADLGKAALAWRPHDEKTGTRTEVFAKPAGTPLHVKLAGTAGDAIALAPPSALTIGKSTVFLEAKVTKGQKRKADVHLFTKDPLVVDELGTLLAALHGASGDLGIDLNVHDDLAAPPYSGPSSYGSLMPLTVSGKLAAKKLHLDDTTRLDAFKADLALKKNIVALRTNDFKFNDGTASLAVDADLTGAKEVHRTTVKAREVNVSLSLLQYLKYLSPVLALASGPSKVETKISLDGNFRGKGFQKDDIEKTLSAKGTLDMLGGKLTGSGIFKALGEFTGRPELQELSFKEFKQPFTIEDGKVINDPVEIPANPCRFKIAGYTMLNGELHHKITLRAGDTKDPRIRKLLADDVPVPLGIGGTLSSPALSPPTAEDLAALAKGGLVEKGADALGGLLAPKKKDGGQAAPGEHDDLKKAGEDLLHGLLGGDKKP